MDDRALLIARLRQRLLKEAGPSGWAYYSGKSSRIEPTCWALLALAGSDPEVGSDPQVGSEDPTLRTPAPTLRTPDATVRSGIAFLAGLQGANGLLVETDPALANLTVNGLALVVLQHFPDPSTAHVVDRLRSALAQVRGAKAPQSADGKQDNQLQGWPWVQDTFSWVEPTAWCLLALKVGSNRLRQGSGASASEDPTLRTDADSAMTARIDEAEKLLANRVCNDGGWNYGNASTLGQDLRPYVPTTAVGLLAVKDKRAQPWVERSLAWLVADRTKESGAFALSLTALSLNSYGARAADVEARLIDVLHRSEESGHLLTIAMALYALTFAQHKGEALNVGA